MYLKSLKCTLKLHVACGSTRAYGNTMQHMPRAVPTSFTFTHHPLPSHPQQQSNLIAQSKSKHLQKFYDFPIATNQIEFAQPHGELRVCGEATYLQQAGILRVSCLNQMQHLLQF